MPNETLGPLFVVTKRFGPHDGERWRRYIESSGLTQLVEVVSMDTILCVLVIDEPSEEDWPHVVQENFLLHLFTDLDHLLRRCGDLTGRNLLCVYRNPPSLPVPPAGPHGFTFVGCDLLDIQGGPSALSNCGGFPLAFANAELNEYGLLPSLDRARQVQAELKRHYPTEHHADCDVWAVFLARP